MEKYAIKSKKSKDNDILILHALPNEMAKFQWYISENICEQGILIDGQVYESYTISAEKIKENNYEGKYIHCEYLKTKLDNYEKTEYTLLDYSIDNMIKNGTIFNDISEFDEEGNISPKIIYISLTKDI